MGRGEAHLRFIEQYAHLVGDSEHVTMRVADFGAGVECGWDGALAALEAVAERWEREGLTGIAYSLRQAIAEVRGE